MKSSTVLALTLAVSAVTFLTACEGDLSAPSRPRTGGILSPDATENDRAWQRENEKPKRDLPTGGGGEFPGQSKATPASPDLAAGTQGQKVVTANVFGHWHHRGADALVPNDGSSGHLPEARYPETNWYRGPLPALSSRPAASSGSTPVPGTPWSVDHSWGEGRPLENYPHRDWPAMQTTYHAATVKHNPVYYAPIQNRLPVPQNDGSYGGNWISTLWETPWFGLQTLALPALVFCDPPLKQVTTQRLGHDPVYLGHQSSDGPIVPSPTPGVIRWEYPFLVTNQNGGVESQPATQPIAPTPGINLRPEETPPSTVVPATSPAAGTPSAEPVPTTTPGLR